MKTIEHTNVVWVRIRMNHPSLDGHNAEMNFMFDKQPTASDIHRAYAAEPFWEKHEHCEVYGRVLAQCLATYGVPQLDRMNVVDKDGYQQAVPMVTALWAGNIIGRGSSHSHHHFGEIRLTHKAIVNVQSTDPEPSTLSKTAKSRSRTVGGHQPDTQPEGRKAKAPPRKP